MATSLTPSLPDAGDAPIPRSTLVFFRERLRTKLYQLVLKEFVRQERAGMKRTELAKRLGRQPAQITRWLNAPSNWTLDTISDLLIGMGVDPDVTGVPLRDRKGDSSGEHATPSQSSEPSERKGKGNLRLVEGPKRKQEELPPLDTSRDQRQAPRPMLEQQSAFKQPQRPLVHVA